jgi:hypothetical protein
VKKDFGRVSRTESGEIHVSLQEIQGELYLDLRIYSRPSSDEGGSEPETIIVPVHMLRDLCQVLEQTKEDLVKEGLVDIPSLDTVISTKASKPVMVLQAEPSGSPADKRREPRVDVRLPVECHLLSAPKDWPTKPVTEQVTGETKDLSHGGLQVWLPEQFPVGSRLAVFIRAGELTFRGQAGVRGVAADPQHGSYRHNLQWHMLDPQARTALLQIMETAGEVPMPRT